jgi:hypothetical protein
MTWLENNLDLKLAGSGKKVELMTNDMQEPKVWYEQMPVEKYRDGANDGAHAPD